MLNVRKFLLVLGFLCAHAAHAKLVWHWKDEFTQKEKDKLTTWIELTFEATQSRIGTYPFDIQVFFHRMEGKGEPCPWANTWRYPTQDIHFHVDPSYSLRSFLNDWTAPHELSHLAIPYIGEKEAWFAEGFASFMQYQVMEEMGIMTPHQVDSAYRHKVDLISDDYDDSAPFAAQAVAHRENRNYKAMYWGGATLFLKWEAELKSKGRAFCGLFPEYLKCCRISERGLDGVIKKLDEVSGYQYGSTLIDQFREQKPSFIFSPQGDR